MDVFAGKTPVLTGAGNAPDRGARGKVLHKRKPFNMGAEGLAIYGRVCLSVHFWKTRVGNPTNCNNGLLCFPAPDGMGQAM